MVSSGVGSVALQREARPCSSRDGALWVASCQLVALDVVVLEPAVLRVDAGKVADRDKTAYSRSLCESLGGVR